MRRLFSLTRRTATCLLFFLAPAFALAAPKIFHVGNGAEPQDLDPQILTGVPEHRLMIALNEGLIAKSPVGEEIEPGVAERWDVSEDGKTYTFHLRKTARWSDGKGITAKDFIESYKRMLTASLAADYSYMLFLVEGAEAYLKGELKDFEQVGFKAIDEYTLQFKLRQAAPFLPHALTHYAWYPVPVHVIEKFGGIGTKGTAWTRPGNIVTNGPFVLKEWKQNQKIVVVRSDTYWDRAKVKLDEIHFYPVESSETEEKMFRAGQLDMTYELAVSKIPAYQKNDPTLLKIDPYCGIYFYRFNVSAKPFDDVRVRKALALAIDREVIVKNITRAGEIPAYSIIPPDVAGYENSTRLKGDIAEAKRLLAEAGYPGGKGFPRVQLLYNTLEKHRTIGEAVQLMWKRNLGIEIGLYNQEWKVYLDSQKQGNFQIQRAGWIADYVDPHVFLDLWVTGGRNNNTQWGNAQYDELLRRSLDANSDAERYAIYRQMEDILIAELPVLPVFFYSKPRLMNPRVLHYRSTVLDNFPFKYVDIKE